MSLKLEGLLHGLPHLLNGKDGVNEGGLITSRAAICDENQLDVVRSEVLVPIQQPRPKRPLDGLEVRLTDQSIPSLRVPYKDSRCTVVLIGPELGANGQHLRVERLAPPKNIPPAN
ncbi:hypothetical protein HY025_00820 [Candidatus Daviesbacteria bacterium]|nr:hypothetical protein [Candidatus Daviesbacteria bacterium]